MPDFWLPFSSATKFGWQFSFLTTKLTNICQKRLLAWAQFTPTLVALKSITFASLRNFSKEWLSKPLQKFHITSISISICAITENVGLIRYSWHTQLQWRWTSWLISDAIRIDMDMNLANKCSNFCNAWSPVFTFSALTLKDNFLDRTLWYRCWSCLVWSWS